MEEVSILARLQDSFLSLEQEAIKANTLTREWATKLQEQLDTELCKILKIPPKLLLFAKEFMEIKLLLDDSYSKRRLLSNKPSRTQLYDYALLFRDELDGFANDNRRHQVNISQVS
ncbi:MAG: hypothetical protein R2865_16420 [Deinococcales bacterium]